MKPVIIVLLLIVGLITAGFAEQPAGLSTAGFFEKRGVLSRPTRQAVNDITNKLLEKTPNTIINNCKFNGFDKAASAELKNDFNEVLVCMRNVTILLTPQQEYIDRLDRCMEDPIKKSKDCLKTDQHYFLEFFLQRVKSLVNFLYNSMDLRQSEEVTDCLNQLATLTVKSELNACLKKTAEETEDDKYIPPSIAEFCKRYIPAVDCFPKTLRAHCTATTEVNQFFTGYSNAMLAPCNITVEEAPKWN